MDARRDRMSDDMTRDTPSSSRGAPAVLTRAEIDALMALPPRPPPSIYVVGDEAVSAITLPRRRPERSAA